MAALMVFDIPAHGVPDNDLRRELAELLHHPPVSAPGAVPLNFELHTWAANRKRGRNDYGDEEDEYEEPLRMGKLIIPDYTTAWRFQQHVGPYIVVNGYQLHLKPSRDALRAEVIERVRREEFVSVAEQERRDAIVQKLGAEIRISAVTFGRLWGRTFNAETTLEAEDDCNFTVRMRVDVNQIHIDMVEDYRDVYADTRITTIAVPFDAVILQEAIVTPPPSVSHSVLLSLSRPPVFSSDVEYGYDEFADPNSPPPTPIPQRLHKVPGISPVSPCLHVLLTFPSDQEFVAFRALRTRQRLRPIVDSDIVVKPVVFEPGTSVYTEASSMMKAMARLDLRVAFQLEVLLRTGILDVRQLNYLLPEVVLMEKTLDPKRLEVILDRFRAQIVKSFVERHDVEEEEGEVWEEVKPRAGGRGQPVDAAAAISNIEEARTARASDHRSKGSSNIQLLLLLKQVAEHTPEDLSNPSRHIKAGSWNRQVIITPTSFIPLGPIPDESNSVLRRYPEHTHHFIRVALRDEDYSKYREERGGVDIPAFLIKRHKAMLTDGLKLAGRRFELLGWAGSSLKEHSAWFVSDFIVDRPEGLEFVTADSIRSSLGDFTKVIKAPARWMARISQAFTATQPSVALRPEQVIRMDDVFLKSSDGKSTCATDGVGTISVDLAREVEVALTKGMGKRAIKRRGKPTVYQIRLGGSKGVVCVDPELEGSVICIRDSMTKFDAPTSLNLDIADTFFRPLPARLNRPLIKLLEDLGIMTAEFQRLQRIAVQVVEQSRKDIKGAVKLFEGHGLAGPSGLGKTLKSVARLLDFPEIGHGEHGLDDPFIKECIDLAVMHALRDLKFKSRIPLPNCFTVVGVADEDHYLEEGEIYACIKQPGQEPIYIQGRVAISRSPSVHPGDLQVVYAVGKLPAGVARQVSAQTNAVVFSVKGSRSLPSCLGGGDLDGDTYQLITLPGLIPRDDQLAEPAEYPPAELFTVNHDCTIVDGSDFFLRYILSDVTGLCAYRHLQMADQEAEGLFHPDCLRLAELHSLCVDYQKSGNAVSIRDFPKLRLHMRPDFMSPEDVLTRPGAMLKNVYESQKTLGVLFREIPLPDVIRKHPPPPANPKTRSLDPERFMTTALSTLPIRGLLDGLRTLPPPHPSLLAELEKSFSNFSEDLLRLCRINTFSRRGDSQLSEAEAFMGTIAETSKNSRVRNETVDRLNRQTEELFAEVKDEITGAAEEGREPMEQVTRAWYAWRMTVDGDQSRFGARAFAWLAAGAIFELLDEVD